MKNQVIYHHSAESIVRNHRIAEMRRSRHWEKEHPVVSVSRPSSRVHRFIQAINWDVVFEWACWAAFAACIGYLLAHAFIPFFFGLIGER